MRQVKMTLSGSRDEVRAKLRLGYLRERIEKECLSYEEIAELQSLAPYIERGDVRLEEWAGLCETCRVQFCEVIGWCTLCVRSLPHEKRKECERTRYKIDAQN